MKTIDDVIQKLEYIMESDPRTFSNPECEYEWMFHKINEAIKMLKEIEKELPSTQPFHNITMSDVLKYIDSMPEDVWQEFTACLECRGWYLQRETAKWCGSDFA